MRLFLSAGEASGDAYAARLLKEMRKLRPEAAIQVQAIGGRQLKASGALMVADSTRWGAMGIFESIKVAPRVWRGYRKARRALRLGDPGLFLPVDFGFMNVRLARYARSLDWRVLYFMPPGSWQRKMQGEHLPEVADEIVTPFNWSAGYLNSLGARAHFYGHPIKQMVAEDSSPFLGDEAKTIAVLPGSRASEIKLNMKVIAKAAQKIDRQWTIEFAIASTAPRQKVVDLWKKYFKGHRPVTFTEGDTIGVLKRARAAIVCSGTATLEAALCRCPMVVIYKLSRFAALEARMLKIRPEFIALPNIVMNRMIVPELIQKAATPDKIVLWINRLTENSGERENQLIGLAQVENELGGCEGITKTASLALQLMSAL